VVFVLEHVNDKARDKMRDSFEDWLEYVVCDWDVYNGETKVLPTRASLEEHGVALPDWFRNAITAVVYEGVSPNFLLNPR